MFFEQNIKSNSKCTLICKEHRSSQRYENNRGKISQIKNKKRLSSSSTPPGQPIHIKKSVKRNKSFNIVRKCIKSQCACPVHSSEVETLEYKRDLLVLSFLSLSK